MATFNNGESGLSVRTKINNVLQHTDGTASELVINDAGADVNFRVESDTKANALFVDGGTGNVGIGTSSPGQELHVQAGTGLGADIRLSGNGGASSYMDLFHNASGAGVWNASNTPLQFATNGTERMRITSTGSVGIGTSSPATALDVTGTVTADGLVVDGTIASGDITITDTFPLLSLVGTTGGATWNQLVVADGSYQIRSGSPARLNIATNGDISFYEDTGTTPKFFWDASAEALGIGTSSPSANLDVSSSGNTSIEITSGDSNTSNIFFGDSADTNAGYILYDHASNFMAFRTNGSGEDMRITSTGNVGIGETAPDYKLDVNGAIGFTPGASVTPVDNGDVVFELTNNTTLTVKAKGSDGVVRSATLTLA